MPIRPIDPKRNIIKRQQGTIITILDRSLRIRHEKAQSVNRMDNVPAITETRDLSDWLISVGWTELSLFTDELANNTFEGLQGKCREFMGGASALLLLRYSFPIASVVDFPEVGNGNHVFSPAKRKPLKANHQPIHRENLEKYPEGSRSVSENTIISLIRIKGLPLARGLIQQGKDILGETDGVFEDALSEINFREHQYTRTIEKAMAGCMVVIALLWNLFQWLPSHQDKPEYRQSSSFVARGSSLEIILPLYDLTYNLMTGKNSPKSLGGGKVTG